MPELPEVETVRRGLAPAMEGARLSGVTLNRADLRYPLPSSLKDRFTGKRVEALGRRAKYLTVSFEGGLVLVCHLGMSGSFRVEAVDGEQTPGSFRYERSKETAHDHVVFNMAHDDGRQVRIVYNDPRRFGFMFDTTLGELPEHRHLATLGVEPTGNAMTPDYLASAFAGRKTPLKSILLDQRVIAGLGNIYVCEALWRARLSPRRQAGTLVSKKGVPTERLVKLTDAIRAVIDDAIQAGGSSLRDHRQTDGSLGYFQHRFAVYDQEGKPCPGTDCKGTIKRIVQSGRSTFFCPTCQR